MRDTIVRNIDEKDKEKRKVETQKEELLSAYHRYREAYDLFRELKESYIHSGAGLQLAMSELLRSERSIGQQAEAVSSSPEVDALIGRFREQLDEVNDKLADMERKEAEGDIVLEDMWDELRIITGKIEELDEHISYLVNRLFHDAVDLTERN